jgi:hypothetical protein
MAAPAVHAQAGPDEWQFRATVYGWFPGLSGTTRFPSGADGPSFNVDASDLISKLKMAFMGSFQARRGRWGGYVDWFYSDVGDTKTNTRDLSLGGRPLPGSATANLSLDVKTNILTLAGTYAAVQKPAYEMNVVFGTRLLSIDQTLDYAFNGDLGDISLPGRSGRAEVSPNNWDAIIGAAGRYRFGDGLHWFSPYYVDIGTGNSKFTWQAIVGLGYSFGWGDLIGAWRYTDYDFKSGQAVQSLTLQGVAVGVSFTF